MGKVDKQLTVVALSWLPDFYFFIQIYNPFIYYPDDLSLLNTHGETWRRQRSVVASAFKSANTAHVSARALNLFTQTHNI